MALTKHLLMITIIEHCSESSLQILVSSSSQFEMKSNSRSVPICPKQMVRIAQVGFPIRRLT